MKNREETEPHNGWTILGPGGGGCVHTLTINPRRPETMLVSCDMTAGYITHDGGKAWREFNLKSRQYAYAFDPFDPDTIWVGSSGLFRSRNSGASWQLIFPDPARLKGETRLGDESRHSFVAGDNWPGKTIHAILTDPDRQGQVFIGIKAMGPGEPFDYHKPIQRQGVLIYTSRDDGTSWRAAGELHTTDIHLMVLDPASPVDARALFVFTEQAVYRLDSASGSVKTLALPGNVRRIQHASAGVDAGEGKLVFYLAALLEHSDDQNRAGILVSRDLGGSWTDLTAGIQAVEPELEARGAMPHISQVAACAADARSVWAVIERFSAGEQGAKPIDRYGILHSRDGGAAWRWVVRQDDFHDPHNREFGWAERDYGAKWGDLTGEEQISPKGRFCWDVVASPLDPAACWTMDFSTIYATRDDGDSWQQLVTNLHPDGTASSRGIDVLSVYGVIFDPFDPQHLALPVTDAGIFHSDNGGRTWRHDLAGVPRPWINTCYWLVFDPEVPGRAWSAWSAMHDIPRLKMFRDEYLARDQGGICKTNDGLRSWEPCAQGLPASALCTHLALDPASPADRRTLYAAVFNHGVYKSVDDGQTWVEKNNGIDGRNRFAWRLALGAEDALYLVVVKNRLPGREWPGAVYRSSDGAESWEPVTLPGRVDSPNDLTCDPAGRLYLACWPRLEGGKNVGGGAYASDNGGKTWELIFDPEKHVYTLTVDPANPSTLYIATFDAALFRSTDRGMTWRQLRGFDFQWGQRPVPDPLRPGWLYVTTFGSSVWHGAAEEMADALEDGESR